ncbi:L,D-transpeptidase family protein [Pseudoroseicyclus aestuarii]|uniref:Murein L,D-transpeptidase YcbB/YkuD n=1 Tax=Pseudoroseicyclus aestuarii TaxID=1795041 RepID=A0A318SX87_9RHOB|nr:L,D-transpeptidase family protein [Pseudoroseicyclus aestuarii]PYE86032.1 murein L,D-transpeptidase YcbB/YkuD [Pseudoroseicyclus aestuarii]
MQALHHHAARGLRAAALVLAAGLAPLPALAQVTPFRQAVAEASAQSDEVAALYRARGFEGLWTGSDVAAIARRNAFLAALGGAAMQGLPAQDYDALGLMAQMRAARTAEERGRMDVAMTRLFLDYARDVQTGLLTPSAVVPLIKREVPIRSAEALVAGLTAGDPARFFRSLPPSSPEYVRLMQARMELSQQAALGGWGPRLQQGARPGDTGPAVVALRDRLVAMALLRPTSSAAFDAAMERAVRRFQASVGLTEDGTVGGATLEALNVPLEERLHAVLVAMERERWTNMDRGDRHIWVNLTDFHATIVDEDRVTFSTRSVIGSTGADRQTPEFSDVMDHMVINPSWYIPRSIIVNEYLPRLRANPQSLGHLQVVSAGGQVVSRNQSFAQYSASSFPYSMRQPPGPSNALGQVKFMFPNRYNIYLHDTPSQHLFGNTVRAYSHGCIRLDDPYDFAYALLAPQSEDPRGMFQSILNTGQERRVNLDQPVPVHLVYRTAFTSLDGTVNYRPDIYGRDAAIWAALAREGVALGAPAS